MAPLAAEALMLIVKGTRVVFVMKEGKDRHAPAAHGMSHDPSGRDWPSKSVLVGPFTRTQAPIEDAKARQYLGRSANVRAAEISRGPRPISEWTKIGEVTRVFYTRLGTKYPGPFQHGFNKGWRSLVFGQKRVILYSRPGFYRLEFPDGATLDDRGFVIP